MSDSDFNKIFYEADLTDETLSNTFTYQQNKSKPNELSLVGGSNKSNELDSNSLSRSVMPQNNVSVSSRLFTNSINSEYINTNTSNINSRLMDIHRTVLNSDFIPELSDCSETENNSTNNFTGGSYGLFDSNSTTVNDITSNVTSSHNSSYSDSDSNNDSNSDSDSDSYSDSDNDSNIFDINDNNSFKDKLSMTKSSFKIPINSSTFSESSVSNYMSAKSHSNNNSSTRHNSSAKNKSNVKNISSNHNSQYSQYSQDNTESSTVHVSEETRRMSKDKLNRMYFY